MSAADPGLSAVSGSLRLAAAPMDVVELAALRAGEPVLRAIARDRGIELPPAGQSMATSAAITLCVRPARWLILSPAATAGAAQAAWQTAAAGPATAVDLSSGLTGLHLRGPAAREVLARGCRLDLDPGAFPRGAAAATIMAQVSVVLVALASGWLLLTPASTARHMREWLVSTGRPFGLLERAPLNVFDPSEG